MIITAVAVVLALAIAAGEHVGPARVRRFATRQLIFDGPRNQAYWAVQVPVTEA
jgi:hypothetical protein